MGIVNRPNGHKWVQFARNGKRYTIRLGLVPDLIATQFSTNIDMLIAYRDHSLPPDPALQSWVRGLPVKYHNILFGAGLADHRITTVEELVDLRMSRDRLKSSTRNSYKSLKLLLVKFFADQPIHEVRPDQCKRFRDWMKRSHYSDATVAKRVRMARSFFHTAVKAEWIQSNPWSDLDLPDDTGHQRRRYVSVEETNRLLAVADADMAMLIVLARYGALRCTSEVQQLTWDDVKSDRFVVHSPKLERFERKATREVPLFPPIAERMNAVPPSERSGLVCPIVKQMTDTAIRKRLISTIIVAEVPRWQKPWQNLRASGVTWMATEFDPVTASRWCGHSVKVADAHYYSVPDSEYARAANPKQIPKQID